jgi:predicted aspartyl protease
MGIGMKRAFVAGGLLVLNLCSAARADVESVVVYGVKDFPEECKLIRQAALPFEWVNGQMVVDVKVNDHPFHFVVDTGGAFSAIDHNAAESIGLHERPFRYGITIRDAGGVMAHHDVPVGDIKIGSLKIGSFALVSVNLPKGEDGVIGPDLLQHFDVEFDPAHQMINLFKPHRCSDHFVYWTTDFSKIRITRTKQGHIKIPVAINGVSIDAVLDTGTAHTFISKIVTASLIGSDATLGPIHHVTAESGGDLAGNEVKLNSFQVGKFNLVDSVVLANATAHLWQIGPDVKPLLGWRYEDVAPGWQSDKSEVLVGTDILQNLHVLMDYRSWQIYVSAK